MNFENYFEIRNTFWQRASPLRTSILYKRVFTHCFTSTTKTTMILLPKSMMMLSCTHPLLLLSVCMCMCECKRKRVLILLEVRAGKSNNEKGEKLSHRYKRTDSHSFRLGIRRNKTKFFEVIHTTGKNCNHSHFPLRQSQT